MLDFHDLQFHLWRKLTILMKKFKIPKPKTITTPIVEKKNEPISDIFININDHIDCKIWNNIGKIFLSSKFKKATMIKGLKSFKCKCQ